MRKQSQIYDPENGVVLAHIVISKLELNTCCVFSDAQNTISL